MNTEYLNLGTIDNKCIDIFGKERQKEYSIKSILVSGFFISG